MYTHGKQPSEEERLSYRKSHSLIYEKDIFEVLVERAEAVAAEYQQLPQTLPGTPGEF